MPELTEIQMGAITLNNAQKLLNFIHTEGPAAARDRLVGLNEDGLYAIFDVLLEGLQVITAARRALKEIKDQDCDDTGRMGKPHAPHTWAYRGQEYRCRGE